MKSVKELMAWSRLLVNVTQGGPDRTAGRHVLREGTTKNAQAMGNVNSILSQILWHSASAPTTGMVRSATIVLLNHAVPTEPAQTSFAPSVNVPTNGQAYTVPPAA